MPRFQTTLRTTKDQNILAEQITNYLKAQGFKLVDGNVNTWKKGGSFSNPLFVDIQPTKSEVKLEAWIRFTVLPGLHVGEFDLDGMFLMVQKRELKKHVEAITQLAR